VNVPLLVAGVLSLIAALIHGGGGEVLVVRKLGHLPSTPFGGPSMTMTMIRVTWHIATIAFLVLGGGLVACGRPVTGTACQGIGVSAATAFTAFALLAFGVAIGQMGMRRSLHTVLFRHVGPWVFVAVAALAWWGVA
jgi:hypothetical protein